MTLYKFMSRFAWSATNYKQHKSNEYGISSLRPRSMSNLRWSSRDCGQDASFCDTTAAFAHPWLAEWALSTDEN